MLSFNKFFIWRKITSCDLVDLLLNLFRLIYFYEGKAAIYKHLVKKKNCGGALWAGGPMGPSVFTVLRIMTSLYYKANSYPFGLGLQSLDLAWLLVSTQKSHFMWNFCHLCNNLMIL